MTLLVVNWFVIVDVISYVVISGIVGVMIINSSIVVNMDTLWIITSLVILIIMS